MKNLFAIPCLDPYVRRRSEISLSIPNYLFILIKTHVLPASFMKTIFCFFVYYLFDLCLLKWPIINEIDLSLLLVESTITCWRVALWLISCNHVINDKFHEHVDLLCTSQYLLLNFVSYKILRCLFDMRNQCLVHFYFIAFELFVLLYGGPNVFGMDD